ncbi:MAG: hypothetical protein CM1200mP27_06670 [Chloroflexota bacterium]|nr:MAG: hypothetical protein CM1200mP27_06670 [Chloroflexota bacterium]
MTEFLDTEGAHGLLSREQTPGISLGWLRQGISWTSTQRLEAVQHISHG